MSGLRIVIESEVGLTKQRDPVSNQRSQLIEKTVENTAMRK